MEEEKLLQRKEAVAPGGGQRDETGDLGRHGEERAQRAAFPDAFQREVAGRTMGKTETCVSTFANENLRVIDRSTVAYGQGRTIYISRLPGACPGIDQLNTLIVETSGGQYCRGDRVRGLEPGAIIPGPSCNLGNWTAYTRP